MTSRLVSKLALAAVLAGAVPAVAAAHDAVPDRDGRPVAVAPAPWSPGPAPVVVERREELRARRWREERRDRELASARAGLRRLDAERAEFLSHPHRRGELLRYERGYLERRAELERRCHELERVAWR